MVMPKLNSESGRVSPLSESLGPLDVTTRKGYDDRAGKTRRLRIAEKMETERDIRSVSGGVA